eukprot:354359-Chlamydomonas_euryale.AAC.2
MGGRRPDSATLSTSAADGATPIDCFGPRSGRCKRASQGTERRHSNGRTSAAPRGWARPPMFPSLHARTSSLSTACGGMDVWGGGWVAAACSAAALGNSAACHPPQKRLASQLAST